MTAPPDVTALVRAGHLVEVEPGVFRRPPNPESTTGQPTCRWCRAPATALRDATALCRPCANVVDELAEHARRSGSGAT